MTPRTTRRYRFEWILLGIGLLVLGALIGYWLNVDRVHIETIERDRLEVQARVIDENLGHQLEGVNNALTGIRNDFPLWRNENLGPAASRQLKALSDAMPGVRTLLILDAGGSVLASNRDELIGRNFREREYFKAPRERPDPAVLYISPPFKTVFDVVAINVTRVVTGDKGEFAGVISATLDPEYFNVLLRSVLYAPDMRAVLVHGDGKAFLFMPPNERMVGIDLARPGSFFSQHRESGQSATLLISTSVTSGDVSMMASRTFERASLNMDKPLVIHVSRELAAIYLPWRTQALAYGVFYGLIAAAAILALHFLQRRRRSFDLAAAEQEKADRLLRHFFDLPFVGMALTSPGTKHWLQFNDRLCETLGYSREELTRKTWAELTHPEDLGKDVAEFERVLRGESEGYAMDKRFIRKDGTVVFANIDVKCTRNSDGTVAYFVAMVQDITGRKQAEQTHALMEAQLRESQKMEALGTLAGGVAHDFNNIVATIMGNVELALQDVGPRHAALESLEEIRKASRRAKDLVQQILAFGRRQVLAREVISLMPVVVESVRLLRSTLPAGVGLSVECAPDAPTVLADATHIEQVLLNLCGNAWQAMQGQKRPGKIEVRLEAYDHAPGETRSAHAANLHGDFRPGRYACLTVRDNGPGMDEATVKRIFEPFFTTKPVGRGTGLGLAVVHGIVQEHKARIEVQSVPGEGTTFRIYFSAVEAPAPAIVAQVPDSAPAPGNGRHILYVDDDDAIVFLMTRLLERQGYRVSGYTDAQEALAAVRAEPGTFDLVVTDYNMPGMSGLDVARALREIRADLPIALASGYITEELRAQAPAAGVIELVYKPNTVDELCEVIARLANAQRGKENSS